MAGYRNDQKDLESLSDGQSSYRDSSEDSTQFEKTSSPPPRVQTAYSWYSHHNEQNSQWRTILIGIMCLFFGYALNSAAHTNVAVKAATSITSAVGMKTPSATLDTAFNVHSPNLTADNSHFWVPSSVVPPKPEGLKVIGLVFYGRPMLVSILDCYLRKNLASEGGYLDEVHFIANTKQKEDLEWLDELVKEVPEYSRFDPKDDQTKGDWTKLWGHTKKLDPNAVVVKIDDDLIFIADDAIPRMVQALLEHPEAYATAGQIINTPHSHFWQYHTGALLPYLPDPNPVDVDARPSWRASLLPRHPVDANRDNLLDHKYEWNYTANGRPTAKMTRWLPLNRTSANLWLTPATSADWPSPKGGATQGRYSDEIFRWAAAAQTHYSFLEHLENDELWRYYGVGTGASGLWDMQYERYSLNFCAMYAGEIAKAVLWLNDEVGISMMLPGWSKKPFLVDTHALVSHYSFSTQHEQTQTDILARYYSYANERVCPQSTGREKLYAPSVIDWHHVVPEHSIDGKPHDG